MKKTLLIVLLILWFVNPTKAQNNNACQHTQVLASDGFGGRKPGTPGIDKAAEYISKYFISIGLTPMFEKGYQYFDVTTGIALGDKNSFTYEGKSFTAGKDYNPETYSNDTSVNAAVVFAGYGFSINTNDLKWDDYQGLDVKNKWVIVLRGGPKDKGKKVFGKYTNDHAKMLAAKDKGAAGIILVTGEVQKKEDMLRPLPNADSKSKSGFAAINLTRAAVNKILSDNGKTIEDLEKQLLKKQVPASFDLKGKLNVKLNIVPVKAHTANVAACLMSSHPTNNYIVIGAHYDHLGMGGPGTGSRKQDTVAIHNGADDNASGTAMVMDLAGRFASLKLSLNYNLIFVAFTGEEMGLLGSAYFVNHPPIELKQIKMMLNFDMVGRLNEKHLLSVGGVGTFPEAENILKQDNDTNLLRLSFSKEGYGPSDHASFYGDSIPVLYFNTGVHGDYHTPIDDFDKINCKGMGLISDFTLKVITDIAQNNYSLTYQEAGPKNKSSDRSGLKVTLGIMPDFANQDIKGVMAAAVTPEGPAFRGGMQKGDIVVGMNGKPVNDIYEYMERLKAFSSGQTITVDVIRNQKKVVLLIQL
jgi:Zn-dependent M28 family amino/carboxypeptidase